MKKLKFFVSGLLPKMKHINRLNKIITPKIISINKNIFKLTNNLINIINLIIK